MDGIEALLAQAASRVQSDADLDVLAEAAGLVLAEQSRLTVADRLARSARVEIELVAGPPVVGAVAEVGRDFVSVTSSDGMEHLVRLTAVVTVRGLASALNTETAPLTRTWGAAVRRDPDAAVQVWLVSGRVVRGRVALSGADHLDVLTDDGVVTCALGSVTRLSRHRMDASPRTRESARTCD